MKLDVTINGRPAQLQLDSSHFEYNGLARAYSLEPSGPAIFSILIEGRSYEATILSPGKIQVNNQIFEIEIDDPRELRARKNTGSQHGRQNIAAPMPGKVVRVLVSVGETIEAAQGLIVVEAMKMQNEMKSPKAGIVVEIKTKDGATVAAGEILIVIE